MHILFFYYSSNAYLTYQYCIAKMGRDKMLNQMEPWKFVGLVDAGQSSRKETYLGLAELLTDPKDLPAPCLAGPFAVIEMQRGSKREFSLSELERHFEKVSGDIEDNTKNHQFPALETAMNALRAAHDLPAYRQSSFDYAPSMAA
jgi:hypothetical protein